MKKRLNQCKTDRPFVLKYIPPEKAKPQWLDSTLIKVAISIMVYIAAVAVGFNAYPLFSHKDDTIQPSQEYGSANHSAEVYFEYDANTEDWVVVPYQPEPVSSKGFLSEWHCVDKAIFIADTCNRWNIDGDHKIAIYPTHAQAVEIIGGEILFLDVDYGSIINGKMEGDEIVAIYELSDFKKAADFYDSQFTVYELDDVVSLFRAAKISA